MSDIAEWLRKEAQRHSQSASDVAFTSRRRSTFKHRAKKLREAADALEQKDKRIAELEAASTYLSAEVKDAWDLGRISVDTFHAALAMDKALVTKTLKT